MLDETDYESPRAVEGDFERPSKRVDVAEFYKLLGRTEKQRRILNELRSFALLPFNPNSERRWPSWLRGRALAINSLSQAKRRRAKDNAQAKAATTSQERLARLTDRARQAYDGAVRLRDWEDRATALFNRAIRASDRARLLDPVNPKITVSTIAQLAWQCAKSDAERELIASFCERAFGRVGTVDLVVDDENSLLVSSEEASIASVPTIKLKPHGRAGLESTRELTTRSDMRRSYELEKEPEAAKFFSMYPGLRNHTNGDAWNMAPCSMAKLRAFDLVPPTRPSVPRKTCVRKTHVTLFELRARRKKVHSVWLFDVSRPILPRHKWWTKWKARDVGDCHVDAWRGWQSSLLQHDAHLLPWFRTLNLAGRFERLGTRWCYPNKPQLPYFKKPKDFNANAHVLDWHVWRLGETFRRAPRSRFLFESAGDRCGFIQFFGWRYQT